MTPGKCLRPGQDGHLLRQRHQCGAPSLPPPISCAVPKWCALVRQYLDGDVRAGVRAAKSVGRWRQRAFLERK
jgi:hypothetical protein